MSDLVEPALAVPPEVASSYGLYRPVAVHQFESYGNDNWLIDDGRGGQFVLRRYNLGAGAPRLEFQLALQRHLAGAGFPAVVAVETKSGALFARDAGDIIWVLYPCLPGEEYDFARPQQASTAGRCLAHFHLLAQSIDHDPPETDHRVRLRQCWPNHTRDLLELTEMFDGHAQPELALLSDAWQWMLAELPLERLDELPAGTVHGDFHGRNLLFDGDDIVAVLDFDDVDVAPYALDVAAGLIKFGRESRGSLRIRPQVARAFIDAYHAVRPLSLEERSALPALAAMGFPPHARNYRYWRDIGREDILGRFQREVTTMELIRAETERVRAALVP